MGTFSLRSVMNAPRVAAEKLYPLPRRMCSLCIWKVWKTKYLCKYLCKLVCVEQSKTTFHGCREFCARKKLPDKSSYVCNLLDNVDKCVPRQQMAADSHSRAAVDTQLGVLGCLSSVCLPVSLSVSRLSVCLSVCPLPCALSWQKWCNASQAKNISHSRKQATLLTLMLLCSRAGGGSQRETPTRLYQCTIYRRFQLKQHSTNNVNRSTNTCGAQLKLSNCNGLTLSAVVSYQ